MKQRVFRRTQVSVQDAVFQFICRQEHFEEFYGSHCEKNNGRLAWCVFAYRLLFQLEMDGEATKLSVVLVLDTLVARRTYRIVTHIPLYPRGETQQTRAVERIRADAAMRDETKHLPRLGPSVLSCSQTVNEGTRSFRSKFQLPMFKPLSPATEQPDECVRFLPRSKA